MGNTWSTTLPEFGETHSIASAHKNTDAKSIYEKNLENKKDQIEEFKKSEVSERIQAVFPDAKLINIIDED